MSIEQEGKEKRVLTLSSQSDLETSLHLEQERFRYAIESRTWEDITADAFPNIAKAQPRPFYLAKLGIITSEINSINDIAQLAGGDKDNLARLRGRLKQLSTAASETITLLYPNVKPEYENEPIEPEDIAKIEAYVQSGAIEQLNNDSVPGWDSLASDQRLLYRLNALQIYYDRWEDVANDESIGSDSIGFQTESQGGSEEHSIKKIYKIITEKVIERHLNEWFDEAEKAGLTKDSEMIKVAKELLK